MAFDFDAYAKDCIQRMLKDAEVKRLSLLDELDKIKDIIYHLHRQKDCKEHSMISVISGMQVNVDRCILCDYTYHY